LSKNGPDAALAAPADTRGEAREPKAPPTWAIAGAVFLTALLVCGTGFSQNPPTTPVSPLLRQGTIHEEELSSPGREPAPTVRETAPETNPEPAPPPESSTEPAPVPTAPAADPDIDAGRVALDEPRDSYARPPLAPVAGVALPQRRASMKLVQQGQTLLREEKYKAALGRFEQAVGLDAANPYSHYFIARAHYSLGNYRESLSFLGVAESKLGADARWLAEVLVLQGRNAAALGFFGRADNNYIRALSLDPHHEFALAQLTTIDTIAGAPRNP
jgi:hypothetical protein